MKTRPLISSTKTRKWGLTAGLDYAMLLLCRQNNHDTEDNMEPCAILLIAASLHVGAQQEYNEIHPALGIECEEWSAGYFENSEGGDSLWAAKRFTRNHLFGEIGLASGYLDNPVIPFARIGYDLGFVEISAMPSIEGVNTPIVVLMAQLKYSW